MYSLIQFTTVTLLYAIAGTLGDFQFLYIDLFLILPIAVTSTSLPSFSAVLMTDQWDGQRRSPASTPSDRLRISFRKRF